MPKIFLGPYAACACCNKTSPFRLCSAGGPITRKPGTVKISHALLTRLYRDVANGITAGTRIKHTRDPSTSLISGRVPTTYYHFYCLKCGSTTSELYWVEAAEGNWIGGWCKYCLHRRFEDGTFGHPEDGVAHDQNILRMNASKKVAEKLGAWNDAWERVKDTCASKPEPEPTSEPEECPF